MLLVAEIKKYRNNFPLGRIIQVYIIKCIPGFMSIELPFYYPWVVGNWAAMC